MTCSMTAFARAETSFRDIHFCWEIKSVNHRYLDTVFRLPEAFRFLEVPLGRKIQSKISRGRLECHLKVTETGASAHEIGINHPLLAALIETGTKIAAQYPIQNDLSLKALLAWPGILEPAAPDVGLFTETVTALFEQAVSELYSARKTEGESLRNFLDQRITKLEKEISKARTLVENQADDRRRKCYAKLDALHMEVDAGRLEQEIALLLMKQDVNEELDRLTSHCIECIKIFQSAEPAGRRLDFLMQEFQREANTLGSKADCLAMTGCALEMKVLIEQMREQIQNIE